MKNLFELRGQLQIKQDEAIALIEKAQGESRSLNTEEETQLNALRTEIENRKKEIALEEERQALAAERAKQGKTQFDDEKNLSEFRTLGDFVQTVAYNPTDKRLVGLETEVRQQSMGVGAQGGFLVPEIFSKELLTVTADEAIVRPRATVFPDQSDADFHIPALQYSGNNMRAGAQVNWIAEGAAKPETDIEFKRLTLHPHEVAAHVKVTDKLLRNAAGIEQVVNTQLRGALIDAEEAAFLTGAGAVQPTGIIGHQSNVIINRNVPGSVVYQDLADMYARFRGRRGVWIVSRTVLPQLMVLADPNGNFVWQPSARDGSPGTIFGMPVQFSENSPALGVQGDVVLADLSYYLIRDGIGVAIAISPHVEFVSNITVIKAFKTVDGRPWLTGQLPTNPTTSPFVVLDA